MTRAVWLAAATVLMGCVAGRGEAPLPKALVADYDKAIREPVARADGIRHVDTPATIARLQDLHVTGYFYLVYHEPTDWSDFEQEFLPAAARAGIDVWVYLVPPSECCAEPYKTDFVRWAEEIARLSTRYPHLRGWAMDDFASNLATFTPPYMLRIREAGRRINPALRFLPVLYHDDFSTEFLQAYALHFDGAIFPYTVNFETAEGLDAELTRVAAQLGRHQLQVVLMIYATKISVAAYPPSATYVAAALAVGLERVRRGQILGVTTYALAKTFEPEDCRFSHHLDMTFPSETPTSAGHFVSATQSLHLAPAAGRYQLRFFEQDSYPIGTAGYHFKQLLVDGRVVWDEDVAGDAALAWTERTVDLTQHVAGKARADITFRVYDKKGVTNFGIRTSVADIRGEGVSVENPDFATASGWRFAALGPGSARFATESCDPDRQRHVYEAVRETYRRYRDLNR
jgi:hypothetical protein